MHPRIVAAREAAAVQGMTESLVGLAAILGQPDPGLNLAAITRRNPAEQQLFRLEALAALLAQWATAACPAPEITPEIAPYTHLWTADEIMAEIGRLTLSKTALTTLEAAFGPYTAPPAEPQGE